MNPKATLLCRGTFRPQPSDALASRVDTLYRPTVETEFLKSLHHCFIGRSDGEFPEPWSSLVSHSLFTLDSYDITTFAFGGLPEFPPDCDDPFDYLGLQETSDVEGKHSFRMVRLKTSLTTALAAVPESGINKFCRSWSQDSIFRPFQCWEHATPEAALKECQDRAFQTLSRFFPSFRLLCQEVCATGRSIYVLWERHEKRITW